MSFITNLVRHAVSRCLHLNTEHMEEYLGTLEGERETIIGLPKTLTMDLLLQADQE